MISFFKYTDGSAFTLNGEDYVGMLNVRNGEAYTGTTYTKNSKPLISKNTLYSDCIINNINFNFHSATNVVQSLEVESIYPRSILTQETITRCLNKLHINNLKLYAAGISIDSGYFNLLTKTNTTLPLTYCLTSVQGTFKGYKLPPYRLPASSVVRFTGLDLLNRYSSSIFFTDIKTNQFEYFKGFGSFRGTLNSSISATFQRGLFDPTNTFNHSNIYYDKYKKLIYEVNENAFSIYNFDWTSTARTLSLKDRMRLSFINTPMSPSTNAFGKTYRCVIAYDNGNYVLEIYKVSSVELIKTYPVSFFNLIGFKQVCMRFEDDIAVIIGVNSQRENVMKVFDVSRLLQTDEIIVDGVLTNTEEYDVYELAEFDSDIIISKNTVNENDGYINRVAFRSITSPTAPIMIYSITPETLDFVTSSDIVNSLTAPINTDPTPLGIKKTKSDKKLLKDVKFSTTDKINAICSYSDSFDVYTTNIYDFIPSKNLPARFKLQNLSESSIGIKLNNMLFGIVEETISLYQTYTSKRGFDEAGVSKFNTKTTLTIPDLNNLVMYGNEYMNAGVLNRIIQKIYSLQQKIAVAISNNT